VDKVEKGQTAEKKRVLKPEKWKTECFEHGFPQVFHKMWKTLRKPIYPLKWKKILDGNR